ncbi:hypothetical protein [Gabonibacter massiliensis]|uniref:hypothetical protein n=1 Tax=Gabonibacter massiliensis TaxID=1720195 RepID=UPI00073E7F16|nr:hypothetical protein [Gabonibacter massiliensis]
MKKIILSICVFITMLSVTNAQSYKETFDSNSLEWTECGYKNEIGTAIIDKGVMTIKSKGVKKGLSLLTGVVVGEYTVFETHCYAPLNVLKPFEIRAKVNVKQLAVDRLVGIVFNYKDNGNYYAFTFNDDFVKFVRYVDGKEVGSVSQGVKWKGKRKTDMEWVLISDGETLTFKVDGISILKIRYMPLSYSGFGFYSFGNQELIVDEVEFKQ